MTVSVVGMSAVGDPKSCNQGVGLGGASATGASGTRWQV